MNLYSVLNLRKREINTIAATLNDFFKIDNPIRENNIKYFRFFIDKIGKQLYKNNLKGLLIVSLDNQKLHSSLIDSAINQIEKQGIKISISNAQLEKAIAISLGTCPSCNYEHKSFFITNLYNVVSDKKSKERIRNSITQELEKEMNFYLYYYSVMYGILNPEDKLFDLFHKKVKAIYDRKAAESKKEKNKILPVGGFNSNGGFSTLNMLLTIIDEYNLDFKNFKWIKRVDSFYKWAMDMKKFNYEEFQPIWITEIYGSKIIEEIKKHSEIKNIIKSSAEFKKNERIKKAYLKIF